MKRITMLWLLMATTTSGLTGCLGPKPVVREIQVHARPGSEGVYEFEAIVENTGSGTGQAELQARLIDIKTGKTYQESEKIDLESHERTAKRLLIRAPVGDYRPEAKVEYPPM